MSKWIFSQQTNRLINVDAARAIIPMQTRDDDGNQGWALVAWYGKNPDDDKDIMLQISIGVSEAHLQEAKAAIIKAVGANVIKDFSYMEEQIEVPQIIVPGH